MKKSPALLALEALALKKAISKYPEIPASSLASVRKYSDKTANLLTKCVIDWIRFNDQQAERINCTGRLIDHRERFENVIGQVKTIGSKSWIPSSGQKGTADISATIAGRSVKIEIKIGADRQSQAQKDYQRQIEQSGGIYLIVIDFDSFYNWYNQFISNEKARQGTGLQNL